VARHGFDFGHINVILSKENNELQELSTHLIVPRHPQMSHGHCRDVTFDFEDWSKNILTKSRPSAKMSRDRMYSQNFLKTQTPTSATLEEQHPSNVPSTMISLILHSSTVLPSATIALISHSLICPDGRIPETG